MGLVSAFSHLLACLLCLLFSLRPSVSSAEARMASRGLHRRQIASAHSSPSLFINTTIHNQAGVDITSSFKTMVFHHQLPPLLPNETLSAATNLTDKRRRSLLGTRQSPNGNANYGEPYLMFRTILGCKQDEGPNWRFERSECDHSRSVQAYTTWCRPFIRTNKKLGREGHLGAAQPQQGSCENHETCINGPERDRQGRVEVAWCIDRDAFVELALDATGRGAKNDNEPSRQQSGALSVDKSNSGEMTSFQKLGGSEGQGAGAAMDDLELSGMTMSAVASEADGVSPLKMQSLDVEAGVLGGDGMGLVSADGMALQEKSCENCVDMDMGKFSKGTEALRTEATVLSAISGVLWIALLAR